MLDSLNFDLYCVPCNAIINCVYFLSRRYKKLSLAVYKLSPYQLKLTKSQSRLVFIIFFSGGGGNHLKNLGYEGGARENILMNIRVDYILPGLDS